MTTSAAENQKEKVEKRRALGRGLESLLPGPRAVQPAGQPGAVPAPSSMGAAGKQQVPPLRYAQGRNDKPLVSDNVPTASADQVRADQARGETGPIVIQTVAQEAVDEAASATAELRSAGQPGAAVPTQAFPTSAFSTQAFPAQAAPAQTAGAQDSEGITIYAQADPSRMPSNIVINLAIADIDKNPFQTRYVHDDDKLEELADSIKANGVVQPIVVRPSDEDEGRYILILGERRLHASKKAGKDTIPAMVRRVSLQQAAEMTIVENLQRDDLSALEQAEAFRILSKEFQLTQAEIGERVGLSRETVSNYMRLLKLPEMVMEQLATKQFGFSEARELLKLEDPELIQKTADYIVKKHLTLDQVEMLIMRMTGLAEPVPGMPGAIKKKSGARWVDPNVRAAQLEMERLLGVRVRIRDRKGRGKIVIEYSTVDDYERVVEMLRGRK